MLKIYLQGSTPTDQEFVETLISPAELLSNLNDALVSIVQLDFKITDLKTGIIETRLEDTLCHFLGKEYYRLIMGKHKNETGIFLSQSNFQYNAI